MCSSLVLGKSLKSCVCKTQPHAEIIKHIKILTTSVFLTMFVHVFSVLIAINFIVGLNVGSFTWLDLKNNEIIMIS